ncbi:MAG: metallophosphoesterase [Ignavibacteriae bacterium]|jgi:serine/threonine protein phosphatase 1|nr:metallophosphoesterase [Ignavibacteriota bacterium]
MIAVIGDIHGCYYTLKELYYKIKNSYPSAEIFSVGDLLDRGHYCLETVEFLKEKEIKFTPGNHDLMFVHFFQLPGSVFARTWIHNDNGETLAAYEFEPEKIWDHIEYINQQPFWYNHDDAFITHAGFSSFYKKIVPSGYKKNLNVLGKIIDSEIESDHGVMWNRDKLLDLGKLQIVGHTHNAEPKFDKSSHTLYIDTGAFRGNKLSAAIVEHSKIIEILSVDTYLKDIHKI